MEIKMDNKENKDYILEESITFTKKNKENEDENQYHSDIDDDIIVFDVKKEFLARIEYAKKIKGSFNSLYDSKEDFDCELIKRKSI